MPCAVFRAPPEAERACAAECRRDCVTTDFGPATGCETCWSRWRTRHRSVLVDRRAGGRPCTNLSKVDPCSGGQTSRRSTVYQPVQGRPVSWWTDELAVDHVPTCPTWIHVLVDRRAGGRPCTNLSKVDPCPGGQASWRSTVYQPVQGRPVSWWTGELAVDLVPTCPTWTRVLVDRRAGGRPCSNLFKVDPCPHTADCTLRYGPSNHRYRLGRWTGCVAFHPSQAVATFGSRDHGDERRTGSRGFTSVIGYRRRSVDCIDVSGAAVDKRSATTQWRWNRRV